MRKALFVLLLGTIASTVFAQAIPTAPPQTRRAESYFHFSKARLLDDEGQWSEAIDEYKKALDGDPNNSLIYSEMAQTYWRHRMVRDAVEAAETAIRYDANNIDAYKVLSDVYRSLLGSTDQQPTRDILDRAIHVLEEIARIDPTQREYVLMLARMYQVTNQRDKAEAIYEKHLELEPGSEEGILGLAQLYLDSGNNREAADLLEDFIEREPESDQALGVLGDAYSKLEQYEEAAAAYKRALDINPDEPELKSDYAEALYLSDKLDEAAALYEALATEQPDNGFNLLRLGQIYRRQMKYDMARPHMLKASQLFPDNIEIQFNLSLLDRDEGLLEDALQRLTDVYKKTARANGIYSEGERQNRRVFLAQIALLNSVLAQYDDAVKSYTELRGISADKDVVDTFIVEAYRNAKNPDKAMQYLQTAMIEFPNSRPLKLLQADLVAERGRVDEGIKILQSLSNGTEPSWELISATATIYERAKKYDDAQKVMDTAIKSFPGNEEVYFMQGALYEKQEKFTQAEAAFRKSLEIASDYPPALNYLGYMLTERGMKLQEALAMIQKAVDSDPTSGAYLDSLGWVYFKLDRLQDAEYYLKRAVVFARTSATMYEHLGDLYYKLGRYPEAAAQWSKGLSLATDDEEIDQIRKKLDQAKTKIANR